MAAKVRYRGTKREILLLKALRKAQNALRSGPTYGTAEDLDELIDKADRIVTEALKQHGGVEVKEG